MKPTTNNIYLDYRFKPLLQAYAEVMVTYVECQQKTNVNRPDKHRDVLTAKLKDFFLHRTQLDPILLAITRDRQLITENINTGAAPGF